MTQSIYNKTEQRDGFKERLHIAHREEYDGFCDMRISGKILVGIRLTIGEETWQKF